MDLTSWSSVLLLVMLAVGVTVLGLIADYKQGKCLPIRRSSQLVTSLSVLLGGLVAIGGGALYAIVRYLRLEDELVFDAALVKYTGIGLLVLLAGSVAVLLLPNHSSNH